MVCRHDVGDRRDVLARALRARAHETTATAEAIEGLVGSGGDSGPADER
jgi:hypothetical protein